jgi:hypothetical protein
LYEFGCLEYEYKENDQYGKLKYKKDKKSLFCKILPTTIMETDPLGQLWIVPIYSGPK